MNQYRVIGNGYIGATSIIGVAQCERIIVAIWGGYFIGAPMVDVLLIHIV